MGVPDHRRGGGQFGGSDRVLRGDGFCRAVRVFGDRIQIVFVVFDKYVTNVLQIVSPNRAECRRCYRIYAEICTFAQGWGPHERTKGVSIRAS